MKISPIQRAVPVFTMGLLLAGCGKQNKFDPPPPAPVTVATPEVRDVTVYKTFPGTLEAVASVEVRARVKGVLEEVHFKDGQLVKQGDPLFLIEQAPFKAKLQAAQARFAEAGASRKLAIATLGRIEQAAASNAVSKSEVDIARAEEATAQAAVALAEADVEDAKINLSYTEIKAQISGRASRAMIDAGNLVDGGQGTLLTTIVDDSRIHAVFEIPERDLLPYLERRPQPGGDPKVNLRRKLEPRLELSDGTIYGPTGKIDFFENQADPGSRTIQVRAEFPNPKGQLAAGLFARIGIPEPVEKAVLVPSLAIQRDLGGEFVWVVGEGDVVSRRGVEAGASVGAERIITEGLEGTERIIVAGLQRAREGAKVTPQSAPAAGEDPGKQQEPAPAESGEGGKAE